MNESKEGLSFDEEMVLGVYRVRLVNKGMGLTHDVLASELKSYPDFELDAALKSLVAKGLLDNPRFYTSIYLLTAKGKDAITGTLPSP